MNMFKMIQKYFNWLQEGNPTGKIEQYPAIDALNETSLKGVYIVGDLTGIPLLKLATDGAVKVIKNFPEKEIFGDANKHFESEINQEKDLKAMAYDVVIIGGGPSGIAAAIEAKKKGYDYVLLEGSERLFNTIEGFPKGKPMFYEPKNFVSRSSLSMKGGDKEKLLGHLNNLTEKEKLNIYLNQKVETIKSLKGGDNLIKTKTHAFYARKTVLAIGKTGNHRRLGIPGENKSHVFYKLFDPGDYHKKKIVIAGGGDSALENAMLLAKAGNEVTLTYRGKEFTRPKPGNVIALNKMQEEGKIKVLFETNIKQVFDEEVELEIKGSSEKVKSDNVFLFLGTQPPYEFFARCGITIENAKTKMTYWWMAFSIAFMNVVYFGKLSSSGAIQSEWNVFLESLFSGHWVQVLPKLIAWGSLLVMFATGIVCFVDLIKNWRKYFKTKWSYIKYGYFLIVMIVFFYSFFGSKYLGTNLAGQDPYFWYSLAYTLSILLFGIRRIVVTNKKYVTLQTSLLILIQAVPLFIIPNFILPWMHSNNWIHPWVLENVFLGTEWWRFVGFILAWPLFIWNVLIEEPSTFWLVVSLIQTFVIIPFIVMKWGKGAYCSWICSCGAMAETMGDEYRTLAWHGPKAKKWENLGQFILLFIFVVTFFHALGWVPTLSETLETLNRNLLGSYQLIVDTLLAGTLGFGLYFFYSGRVWCRFACPLAALMHIYNRFGQWGILADKKKCISCGLCTKACHMGIDVMNYANKGLPVNDAECVNCSACVNVCPTGVLSFGKYRKLWKN